MGERCQIQIKIHEGILLHTAIRDFDARNGNKFVHCRAMSFFGFVVHPRRQRHFVFPEYIPQVLLLGKLLLHCFHDFLRLHGRGTMCR